MGIAILSGIMAHLEDHAADTSKAESSALPAVYPFKFITCVRRKASGDRITKELGHYKYAPQISIGDNVGAVQKAEVVMLGCKPWMFRDVLGQEGIRDALRGKLLISVLAGVSSQQIEDFLYGEGEPLPADACRIVRAMPNTAAFVRESMTVVELPSRPLPEDWAELVTFIFSRIGRVSHLPQSNMDASTALCGSGPAFAALMLEALADGAVAMGLPRVEAQTMAAQVMRGASSMVLSGEHPAILRDKTSTPGGCTIGGLMTLEEGRVRGSVARAVREATVVASQLGQGVKLVNGTRFTPQ